MHLIYNGIEMECLEIPPDGFIMESVYDDTGTDYLYTRVSISGLFLINGQANVQEVTPITSYDESMGGEESLQELWARTAPNKLAPKMPVGSGPEAKNNDTYGFVRSENGPFPLRAGDGIYTMSSLNEKVRRVVKSVVPSVNTATVVRSRLNAPRGRLFVFTGNGDPERKDELLLQSPVWNTHTDCKNGPIAKAWGIQSFAGDAQTMIGYFSVETFINEMKSDITGGLITAATPKRNPLLSNRFSMQHVIDEDSYLTIVVQGKAIFRTDFLYGNQSADIAPAGGLAGAAIDATSAVHNPDQMRLNLLLPVPFGMIREQINIDALPDGTGLSYSFVDRQQYANFVMGPYAHCTQIQAIHRQAISIDDEVLTGALHAYERVLNLRAQRKWAAEEDPHPSSPKTPKGPVASSSPPPPPPFNPIFNKV